MSIHYLVVYAGVHGLLECALFARMIAGLSQMTMECPRGLHFSSQARWNQQEPHRYALLAFFAAAAVVLAVALPTVDSLLMTTTMRPHIKCIW